MHHSWWRCRRDPHALPARPHRRCLQRALDGAVGRLDRRKLRRYRVAGAVSALCLSDDVSALGPIELICAHHPARDRRRRSRAEALVCVALFRASPADLFRTRGPQPRTSPIIEVLEREISLHPGQVFRGSVATLLGAAASPLRQQVLGNAERPLEPGAFEKFLQRRSSDTGSTHDLLDLWWRDIPTLSEYGQGLSKPLMFYVANVFNSPQDAQDLNFALPRLANIDVLRAMGVRFAITDLKLPADRASVRRTALLRDGIELYLYELAHSNIAGFSPLKLSTHISPSELLHRIRENPALFESEAFVDPAATTEQLVPVQRSRMIFERGAVHVSATSAGVSALLLPLQFSHCFRLIGGKSDRIRVLRANLIHTLVLFAGELDIRLKWEFSFWRNSACRLRDAEDARALGLR